MSTISELIFDNYEKTKTLTFPEGIVAKSFSYKGKGLRFVFEDGSELVLASDLIFTNDPRHNMMDRGIRLFYSTEQDYEQQNISKPILKK